ncbi:hypothetical protein EDB81DRAFT_893566 [Dactylonectria macrodidyma]|uniref:Uncharacterized protein n=1 Tax=Dactylonectria macrodidyma TaxID=307937 RepID=A0A9P9IB87_9HYPO|nr:hypothetical protein EDB81DRAFT_893566 [Dactylonectria macrodidyma]
MSQVVEPEQPPAAIAPPQTPRKRKFEHPDAFTTPKSARDLTSLVNLLYGDVDKLDRDLRAIISKMERGFERKNGLITALIKKVEFLEKDNASHKAIGRKAVDYEPNEAFATIPEIEAARYEAAMAQARFEDVHGPDLFKEALEIAQMEKEKMFMEWQL